MLTHHCLSFIIYTTQFHYMVGRVSHKLKLGSSIEHNALNIKLPITKMMSPIVHSIYISLINLTEKYCNNNTIFFYTSITTEVNNIFD